MHYFRLIVRNAFVEALVECKQMTCGAGVGEFYWRHEFAARNRLGRLKPLGNDWKKLVAVSVANRCGEIFGVRISEVW